MPETWTAPPLLRWATIILGLLSLVYLVGGFHDLVTDETYLGTVQHLKSIIEKDSSVVPQTKKEHANDTRLRWTEQAYVHIGVNPYTIAAHPENADPRIGPLPCRDPGGYPPWAFLTQEVLVPQIPFAIERWYFVGINVLAYCIIAWWAYLFGRRFDGVGLGLFMVAITLACSGNLVNLRWGNYVAIVMALLIGMNYFSERQQELLAGLCLGFAMIKPQDAMLFTFVLLVRKQLLAVVVAVGYTIVAGCISAWRVGTNPLVMLDQMFKGAMTWTEDLHLGILDPIKTAGIIPTPILTKLGLVAGVLVAAGLMWRYRSRSSEVLMAIAAVVSMATTYHRRYDGIILAFLLVPLALRALRDRSAITWIALVLNGLFLWLPLREVDYFNLVVSTAHCVVAIWGLVLVLQDPTAVVPETAPRGAGLPLRGAAV
ncbi:MAG TPA: glycosyltransferase family 87 protein [Lacipirellulaceae bacterium]|jgi:hypothetical protein|nr:glycosyltransferase family 87 protein [Lacipirellulaceae bacterium]